MTDLHKNSIANSIATRLLDHLRSTCETAQIAGSIRRAAPWVKDAEIVAIPTNATYARLEALIASGAALRAVYSDGRERWGMSYRGLNYDGLRVEIFFTERASWGYMLALRTGPREANEALMSRLIKTSLRCQDGAVYHQRTPWLRLPNGDWDTRAARRVIVPDEQTFFRILGVSDIAPHLRHASMYNTLDVRILDSDLADAPNVQQSLF